MAPDAPTWQWSLTLRPDPVGASDARVLRAPSGLALQQALSRAIEARWRDAFEDTLEIHVARSSASDHESDAVRLSAHCTRHNLDLLVNEWVALLDTLVIRQENQAGTEPKSVGHWTFVHGLALGMARPPLEIQISGLICCNAWPAELALKSLGALPPIGC